MARLGKEEVLFYIKADLHIRWEDKKLRLGEYYCMQREVKDSKTE